MAAQQTCFTVCQNPLENHMNKIHEQLMSTLNYPISYHYELIIPLTLKQDFLHRLRVMNITASSLYPGIDGAGASIAEYIRLMTWAQTLPNAAP
jgi:hypothetical protein